MDLTCQTECIVWCPACREVKFEVKRKQVSEGIYIHVREPQVKQASYCSCGTQLERK